MADQTQLIETLEGMTVLELNELVKALEEHGIGRPSTFASIIGTVIDRGYATKRGQALVTPQ